MCASDCAVPLLCVCTSADVYVWETHACSCVQRLKVSPQAKKKGRKEITSEGKEETEETEEDDFHTRPVRSVVGAVEENATLCVIA